MATAQRTTHTCPCGCGQQVPRHLLACPAGWRRLPADLRLRINAAWRRRRLDPAGHRDAVTEALAWYRDNRPEGEDQQ